MNTVLCKSYPDKKAFITSTGDITYGQFFQQIEQYAQLFGDKSYTKVAIYAENSVNWISAFYATLQNECIAVPIDFLSAADEVAYIIDDCKPELIFISKAMTEAYEKANTKTNHKPELVVFEDIDIDKNIAESKWTAPADFDETAAIIYTSGTTGSPKGVMLSYTNMMENVKGVVGAKIFIPEREVMIFLPLHHVFPLVGSMLTPLSIGSTVVIVPSMQSADLMKCFANNQVGVFMGVPRLYELMYRGIKAKIDASAIGRIMLKLVLATKSRKLGKKLFKKVHESFGGHMQYMIAGGAALNKEVGTFFDALGFNIMEGYGMTEAAPMITFPRPGRIKIGTTGEALPGISIEIRDGEIVAKGPGVTKGYYNRPEETAEVIKDGWLYTGDLGHLDDEGYLHITGRKKEIIVLPNGKNINPVELEIKLEATTTAIKEAGVIMHNEMLHAVIVPNFSQLAEEGITNIDEYFREQVIAPLNAELSSYKRIMQFTLVKTDLPRTRLSKLQRFKMAELLNAKQDDIKTPTEDAPKTSEYIALKNFIETQVDMDVLPDHHIVFDISMDSLGKLSLIDFIEKKFGIEMEEEQLLKFPSVRKMAEHIKENKRFHKKEDHTSWSGNLKETADVKLPKAGVLYRPLIKMTRSVFSLFFKFSAKGQENIPDGPCFITPNHETKLDAFLVLSYLNKKTMLDTFSYAKEDHVKSGVRKYLARNSNVIIMDLSNDLKASIQKLAEVVKQGKKVLIFPEGTRTLTGQMGSFKETYALISTELNIPIVPVAIKGGYAAMSSGEKKMKTGSAISIEFLPAIEPENMTSKELNQKVKKAVEEAVK